MTDFTLRMSGLPFDKEFGGNPDHLKVYLIAHFQKIIDEGKAEWDRTRKGAGIMLSPRPTDEFQSKITDIVDITFGSDDMYVQVYLLKLS